MPAMVLPCAICAQSLAPFASLVLHAASAIPEGRLATYGVLASCVGSPGGARAVGSALSRNSLNSPAFSPRVSCHRVVRADGGLGGFNGGLGKKQEMLREEGITVGKDDVVLRLDEVLLSEKDVAELWQSVQCEASSCFQGSRLSSEGSE